MEQDLKALRPLSIGDLERITDMAVMILDAAGRIICYSKGCEKIEALRREDVIGKSPESLYNPQQFPNLTRPKRSMVLDTLKTGKVYRETLDYYTTVGGNEANILCSTYPIYGKNGQIDYALCIYREVSDYLEMIAEGNKKQSDRQASSQYLPNGTQHTFDHVVGSSPMLQKAVYRGKIAAKTDAPVLIWGETGTGKEVFAQSIHNYSAFSSCPFVAVNCSAIPEALLESTLFGTCKGSYTGAVNRRGLLEEAENGTLFLDELNAMDIGLQSKLLRVLETGRFRAVGGQEEKPCKCRIISAINEEPFQAIENNHLRADLYYRLAVFSLELPPLIKRREDIAETAEFFIGAMAPVLGKKVTRLSAAVKQIFECHSWPGNVRELRHIITQAIYFAEKDEPFIKPHHLPEYLLKTKTVPPSPEPPDTGGEESLARLMNAYEAKIIERALEKNGHNISQAARQLHISRTNLHNKIKKYQLEKAEG
ncbi:sigma 54-interacting transcriptional regulator [Eubacterium sp. 1001713B170207_170306_E7]|uniref:sigma-54 interaction domain-containing protein n=1 Tax=Eubacterium sp. 1001713B170207_170306_E7 TaxID=2787097 RepID=UPI00189A7316|nr:sigma 54-interacting transcriptional regulator [Eubacterium sp. 1001713B170207_170306_E7]